MNVKYGNFFSIFLNNFENRHCDNVRRITPSASARFGEHDGLDVRPKLRQDVKSCKEEECLGSKLVQLNTMHS